MTNRRPPMHNNKPVKALHTHAVWKIQHLAMPYAVFATRPHPWCCIFHTALAVVLIYITFKVTSK